MRNAPEPMRVLLIDDDGLSREILEMLLDEAEYAVVGVGSGEEALALLRSGLDVEVILSDLRMPGLAGAELAAALRAACARMPAALLAMSASVPEHGATVGYDGFLGKPFAMEELSEAVRRVETGARQGGASEGSGELRSPAAHVLDDAHLQKLQASFRPEQMDELFQFALTDAERQVETMKLAAANGDEALYRRCAHSMKGSFGMLGAPELRALSAAAENGSLEDFATVVTSHELFLGALSRLRLTLIARGICQF